VSIQDKTQSICDVCVFVWQSDVGLLRPSGFRFAICVYH